MKASLNDLLAKLPGPNDERFVQAMTHGTMSVELYSPLGRDPQQPHAQDELYFVIEGRSEFVRGNDRIYCEAGDVLFVPAGMVHRFEHFSSGFKTWVVFWGPNGGEKEE